MNHGDVCSPHAPLLEFILNQEKFWKEIKEHLKSDVFAPDTLFSR